MALLAYGIGIYAAAKSMLQCVRRASVKPCTLQNTAGME